MTSNNKIYVKKFDEWIKDKEYIHNHQKSKTVKKGEIWWASLGVNVGVEIDGKKNHFERPVLIAKKIDNKSAFVIPLTSTIRLHDTRFIIYKLNNGEEKSAAIAQARMIDTRRLSRMATFRLTNKDLDRIFSNFTSQFDK